MDNIELNNAFELIKRRCERHPSRRSDSCVMIDSLTQKLFLRVGQSSQVQEIRPLFQEFHTAVHYLLDSGSVLPTVEFQGLRVIEASSDVIWTFRRRDGGCHFPPTPFVTTSFGGKWQTVRLRRRHPAKGYALKNGLVPGL